MDAFIWNPCFVTGLVDVDAQHQRLVDLINRFGERLTQHEKAADTPLAAVFGELAEYAQYHFREEETLMAAHRVDARHVQSHCASHTQFLDEVGRLHASANAGDPDAARALFDFLTHWLAYHILGADQIMARQIAAIEAGMTPVDAYLAQTLVDDPATETLLAALNGLFEVVSERNRALERLNRTLEARVGERTAALSDANRRLEDIAHTDPLTGLRNRRFALRSLSGEWEAAQRDATPLACLMIDADGFKRINDEHGHDAGDAVLQSLARRLQDSVRRDDLVCRIGGDEFLVICPRTPVAGALQCAETLRVAVAALRVPAGDGVWAGSVSIGVAALDASMRTPQELLKAADLGAYIAKRDGRNRVACVQTAEPAGAARH